MNKHELFIFLAGCNYDDKLEGMRLVAMQNVWRFWSENPKNRGRIVDVTFIEKYFIDYKVIEFILTGVIWLNR